MKLQKKPSNKYFVVFAIIFIIIASGYLATYYMTLFENKKMITLHVDGTNTKEMNFVTTHTDPWFDGEHPELYIAEYDSVLSNNEKTDFYSWTITMNLSKPSTISGMWNGNYEQTDDYTIVVTPVEYNQYIRGNGGTMPYGYILASTEILDIHSITISGYYVKDWKERTSFHVCSIFAALWLISLIVFISIRIRVASYLKRQKHDESIIIHSMNTLIDFIEAKDSSTKGHSKRVANYTKKIAQHMHLPKETIREYYYIALMHDCGKIGIPDNILKKASSLTDEEYEIIKTHTTIGAQMLSNFKDIKGIQEGALQHHERYDGSGYPNGLKGNDISLIGRIICIADSFDVMNCDRCYRSHISQEMIMSELKENAGKQFDPEIVQIFIEMLESGEITFNVDQSPESSAS